MTRGGLTTSRYLSAPQYGEIRKLSPNNTDSSKSSTRYEGDHAGIRAGDQGVETNCCGPNGDDDFVGSCLREDSETRRRNLWVLQ